MFGRLVVARYKWQYIVHHGVCTTILPRCARDSVFERVCLSRVQVPTADSPGVNIFPSNNASQLCLIEQLYNIQNNTGTLTADDIVSPELIVPILTLPQNVTCNNCTKEAYNIIITKYPQDITSHTNSTISNQCGADFLSLQPSFI